jgi:hypothetical protein
MSGELRRLNLEAIQSTHMLVKGIPYVEFSYTEQEFVTPVYPFEDLARDNIHPGAETQYKIAQWINNELRILL